MADTLEPGATVNGVAARYAVLANQLSSWRRLAKLVLPAAEVDEPAFAPLVVCDVLAAPEPNIAPSEEVIRLVSGAVRIELAPVTPAMRIAEIVHALGATPC